jgi:hypothetical protein
MLYAFEETTLFHNEVESEGKVMIEDRYTIYKISKCIVNYSTCFEKELRWAPFITSTIEPRFDICM